MKGGPRNGSGRDRSPASRTHQTRIMMTRAEFEDLELLSEQWDIPIATAAYGIFADSLARYRSVKPHSPHSLVLAASRCIAQHIGDMQDTAGYEPSTQK